jgi:hypothetical protein
LGKRDMKTKGQSARRIYRQPGGKLTISKDSVATATETYRGDYLYCVLYAPRIGDPHPDFPGLKCTEKSPEREKLGFGRVDVVYKGLDPAFSDGNPDPNAPPNPDQNLPLPTVEYGTITIEAPIETHPDFWGELVPSAGGFVYESDVKADTSPAYAVFTDDGEFKFFGNDALENLAGVKSYLKVSVSRTTTWVSLGRADDSKVGEVLGGWMQLKLTSRAEGGVWHNVLVEQYDTWNDIIYNVT